MALFRRKSSLVGVFILAGLCGVATPLSGGEPVSREPDSSSQGRNGLPTGLQGGHPQFQVECGLLINARSWSALQPFFEKERPRQGRPGNGSRSRDPSKLFLALLYEIFGIPSDPCP